MPGLLLRAGQRYCKFVHYMLEYLHWDSIMVIQTNVQWNNDDTIFLKYKQYSFLRLQNGANVCTCLVLAPDYVPQQVPMLMLRDYDLNNIHAYIP